MAKRKARLTAHQKLLLRHLCELRAMLAELNQKLDHLIQSCRRFHFTDDFFSRSSTHEFNKG
jgi:hypothetical protein